MSRGRRLCPLAAVAVPTTAALLLGASAQASNQLLMVPVRWCALKGSPAADTPGRVGEPDTDNALWRRHERASDRIWLAQGTQITFRSAFTNDILVGSAKFPVIDDPSASPGEPGDLLDPNEYGKSEFEKAKQACRAAWDKLAPNASLLGPIALNVRRLVKPDNTENLQGYGELSYTGSAANLCANPPSGIDTAAGAVAIADYELIRSFDPDEEILAHEFGHSLGLEHGNGLDDNANGVFDGYGPGKDGCDPAENPAATPNSLMTPGVNAKLITGLQKQRTRKIGLLYSGAQSDPPAALVPGETIGDEHVDTIGEVADRSVDIAALVVTTHTPTQTTSFAHELIDLLPDAPQHQYIVFADLDNDATTGGAAADLALGVPTTFTGAELATRVLVYAPDGLAVIPTLWKFQGGAWVEIDDPSIGASVDTVFGGESFTPQYDVVSLRVPNAVRGPMDATIRIQGFAQTPAPLEGGSVVVDGPPSIVDQAPDLGIGFDLFRFVQPAFPVALVTPFLVRPGQAVLVEAVGLFPDQMAKIFFGDTMVAGANSDATGAVTRTIVVPFDAAAGERLVTVGTVGTGLTADTSAVVQAGGPLPPTPVAIDVKPTSCPNPLNVRKSGVLPVAILGSATLDVSQLDPSLLRLEGVAPLERSSISDVAAPFLPITGRTRPTDCTTAGTDGYADLVVYFDAQQIAAALGAVSNKQTVVVHLTGNFQPAFGGAPISGEDVIVTLTK